MFLSRVVSPAQAICVNRLAVRFRWWRLCFCSCARFRRCCLTPLLLCPCDTYTTLYNEQVHVRRLSSQPLLLRDASRISNATSRGLSDKQEQLPPMASSHEYSIVVWGRFCTAALWQFNRACEEPRHNATVMDCCVEQHGHLQGMSGGLAMPGSLAFGPARAGL